MFWFKDKDKEKRDTLAAQVTVDVKKHKKAMQEAIENVNNATNTLNEVFKHNGFTVTISSVIRGKH